MKRAIAFCVVLLLIITASFPAFAYDMHPSDVELTAGQLNEKGAWGCIENELKKARDNANPMNPITITLPSGTYKLNDCLHIYSYTNLVLQPDTVLVKNFDDGNMLKVGKEGESFHGYDGYRNINITGGVWDENFYGDSCGMRFAHCSDIAVSNVTIKNNKNSHHIELAAANNFVIKNCTFSGYKRSNSADGMAVQIDVLHYKSHFPSYSYYDDTPCKNITVSGCKFENVYSGVGAYSGVIGSYFTNIVIKNNTFSGIKDKAIAAFNFIDSVISGNTVNGCTLGILYELYPFEKLSGRFYKPYNSSNVQLATDSNTVIKNNTVTVTCPVGRASSAGIAVYGGSVSAASAKKNNLIAGQYYVRGISISRNTVSVNSTKAAGMRLENVMNSAVKSNTIKALKDVAGGFNGVVLRHSQSNAFTSNIINRFDNSIAFQTGSVKNTLKNNTLKNTLQYGVAVDSSSSLTAYYGNTFRKNGKGKILIQKKTLKPKTVAVKNLTVKKKSLTWDKMKGVTGYKIYRSTNKGSGYTLLKTIKGKRNHSFTDKTAEKGKKYYYKVSVYKKYKESVIHGIKSDAVKIKY